MLAHIHVNLHINLHINLHMENKMEKKEYQAANWEHARLNPASTKIYGTNLMGIVTENAHMQLQGFHTKN